MLDSKLMSISPEAPLSPGGACRLARESLVAAAPPTAATIPFELDGALSGRVLLPSGEKDLGVGPWVCAIGAFDGLHLGHRELLAHARGEADARGCRLAAVTFSPDPADVLVGVKPATTLLTCAERQRGLLALGADAVIVFDFTRELAAFDHAAFMRRGLCALLDVRAVVVGADFRLGAGGAGGVGALSEVGRVDGFDVIGLDLLDVDGAPVTATRIRGLVRAGRVEAAAGLLGRCHAVTGHIEHGRGEGTSFGFPTANVMVDASACVPEQGVYAALVALGPPSAPAGIWPAAVNVGLPPTFAEGASGVEGASRRTLLEANLIGFEGDAYGLEAHVTFVRWLRDSRPFSSLDELERTVLGNIDWCARSLGAGDASEGGVRA